MHFLDYQPLNIELMKHQRETMLHILKNVRCSVLDGIGTGKTLSSLSAVDFLFMHGRISKVLIISPLSVTLTTWVTHILQYFPYRTFTTLLGPNKEARIKNLALNKDLYIVNTDGIKVIQDEIIKKKFDVIIVDESTTYSYYNSDRTKVMWDLARRVKSVILLTGNPIPNDTLQSYGQAKILDYNRIRYYTKFRDQLKYKLNMYTYIDREDAVDLAYSVLQPSIRHTLESCTDMPEMVYQERIIKLTKEQERHYLTMEKEYITMVNDKIVTAANSAVRYTKLLQISCGLIIDNEGNATDVNHKHRVNELKEILGQTNKVVVFANFTKSINSLMETFPFAERIDGSTPNERRRDIVHNFQNSGLKMIVAHPKAISYGVTLHAADTIVWWSPCLSGEAFEQCNGRIRRIGQKRPQLIIKFTSTRSERKVYKSLERKMNISQSLLTLAEEDTISGSI